MQLRNEAIAKPRSRQARPSHNRENLAFFGRDALVASANCRGFAIASNSQSKPPLRLCASAFKPTSHGFTLVEVALAILAVGLGLLAIFGVSQSALENTVANRDDARCDRFANAVFGALRETDKAIAASASSNLNSVAVWRSRWAGVKTLEFPPVAGMNTNVTALKIGGVQPAFDENDISLEEWNPYYELGIYTNGYSEVAGGYNYLGFRLAVIPDGSLYDGKIRWYKTSLFFGGGLP